jgi:hypothetical protein
MPYLYQGIPVSSLTEPAGTPSTSVPGFSGFPLQQPIQNYTSTVTNPFPLSYLYQNTSNNKFDDVAVNYCTAYTTGPLTGNGTIPSINIPGSNPIVQYKHISAYGWGGGGGGGGGGGAYTGNPFHTGGNGGNGAAGAYAGTVQARINATTINYTVGTGGSGGKAGGKNPNASAGKGTPGSPGNNTTITIGNAILTAPGGNGGTGGQGGNVPSDGANGGSGNIPTSDVNSGSIQNPPLPETPSYNWPAQNSGNAGSGGNGSNGNSNSANRGNAGSPGYLQIYFIYDGTPPP